MDVLIGCHGLVWTGAFDAFIRGQLTAVASIGMH
jgi:hypothetical protein